MSASKSKARKIPWGRRILSLVILAALLTGIIFVVVKAIQWGSTQLTEQHQQATVKTGPTPVQVNNCKASDLQADVASDPAVLPVGAGATFTITVTNRGTNGCLLETENLQVSLLTGDETVWSPTVCSDSWVKPLLIPASEKWSSTLAWDGAVYQECTLVTISDGQTRLVADPGTYRMVATVSGEAVGTETTVVVQ